MLARSVELNGAGVVHVVFTTRPDGDFADGAARLPVGPARHAWLRQKHGRRVVAVDDVRATSGAAADAAITARADVSLTIRTADCAPIALIGAHGMIGAVHAGWRGLQAGVVGAALAALRSAGEREIDAIVGPCIHSECYEFGSADLAALQQQFGAAVGAMTSWGTPAFDLPAAVTVALQQDGIRFVEVIDRCTACGAADFFSHRARSEAERHVMIVWRDREPVAE